MRLEYCAACLGASCLCEGMCLRTSGKFDTGVESLEYAGRMQRVGQQRQPWAQPSFQLGVKVCISEKLVMKSFFSPKHKVHTSELLARLSLHGLSFFLFYVSSNKL